MYHVCADVVKLKFDPESENMDAYLTGVCG